MSRETINARVGLGLAARCAWPPPRWPACRRARDPAAPASASQEITEFNVASSNSQSGAHGDFIAKLRLGERRPAGGGQEPDRQRARRGSSATRARSSAAAPRTSSSTHCAPGSQVGLITIVANYEGVPNTLLGTAPIYNMETVSENEAARLEFVAPTVKAPIVIPIGVRSDSDYGLTTDLLDDHADDRPLAGEHDGLGLPGRSGPRPGAVPARRPRLAARAARANRPPAATHRPFPQAGNRRPALHRQPERLHRANRCQSTLDVTTYQDPTPSHDRSQLPGDDRLRKPEIRPGLQPRPDQQRGRPALGARHPAQGRTSSSPAKPRRPSTLRSGTLTLPEGLTINPDAADGQTACTDAQAGFGTEQPGPLPGQLEDRDDGSDDARPRRPPARLALHRPAETGRPVPGVHDLRRLRDPRQAARLLPARPADGQADGGGREPAAGPVRSVQPAPVRLRPRPGGDARPAARSTRRTRTWCRGTRSSRRSARRRS